jgi:2'-5' RNA ligase
LSLAVDDAIGSGIYDERNAPRPHLTVGRGVSDEALAHLRTLAAGLDIGWTVDRIVLFRSHTEAGGSRYEALAGAALGT